MEHNQNDPRISPSPQTAQEANAPQSPQPLRDPTISPRRLTRKISGLVPILCGLMLIGSIPLFIFGAVLLDEEKPSGGIFMALAALMLIVSLLLIIAIKSVKPNEAAVFTLFGNYYGTIDQPGLYLLNPFVSSVTDPARKGGTEKKSKDAAEPSIEINIPAGRLSLKVKTLNNERQKVNDLLGNPVILETVVFWRIVDPTKAVFNVDNYFEFLSTQCDSVVRNIARLYPYDNLGFDDVADSEKTLMGSSQVIADEMQRALQEKNRQVLCCKNIQETRQHLHQNQTDLLILDVNLPDGSGFDLLQEIRRTSDLPVILLTANDLEMDIVSGLEQGANDYITKPFSLAVLRARVNTQLRNRTAQMQKESAKNTQIWEGSIWKFDFTNMRFTVSGQEVELSKTEQKLLALLVQHAGMTVPRETLMDRIWTDGAVYVDENALSVAIKRLRDKLQAKEQIRTVYGIGYVWEV